MLDESTCNEVAKCCEGRQRWWKSTLKETPVPGSYEHRDFIQSLDAFPISKTYGFKSSGRKRNADPSRTGGYLMPGLYKHKDFIEQNHSKVVTYNFKSSDRSKTSGGMCGTARKEAIESKVDPTTYDKGFTPVEKLRISDPTFKSQSQRFPTIYFRPKKGPGPGHYNAYKESEVNKCRAQTAPFKSRTPRFTMPRSQATPGPGAYTKLRQFPMPPHIKYVGRYHGLFYPPGIS